MRVEKLDESKFREILGELIDVYMDGYRDMEEYAYRTRGDARRYLKWLYRCDPEVFLVAIEDEKITGFIAGARNWWDKTYGDIGEIHELVVRKEFQGKGMGRGLLEKEIEILKRYHNTIGLWVGEKNFKAIRFYEGMGFRVVGKVGVWLRMIRED